MNRPNKLITQEKAQLGIQLCNIAKYLFDLFVIALASYEEVAKQACDFCLLTKIALLFSFLLMEKD